MNQMLYEPCFCGSGKKTKFCCPDLAADWDKIQRLLEADQTVGALEHLNRVIDQRTRQGKPDHPALLAERITTLRKLRRDQWRDEADRFVALFPENARAITWQGIRLLDAGNQPGQTEADLSEEQLRSALDRWSSAREACDEPPGEWLALTLMLAQRMIDHEWFRPAVFILTVLASSGNPPEWIANLYNDLQSDESIPLVLRWFENFGSWPEVEQSPALSEAWLKIFNFDWRRAERELTELTGRSDAPAVAWRLLAETRLLLGKTEEARAALRAYIEKWPSSADVFEAELLLLSIGPRRDLGWVPLQRRKWKVLDVDRVQEAIISDARCALVDESNFARVSAEARPRVAAQLFQARPLPEDAELTSAEQAPFSLGHLLLFGKQTDRDAVLTFSAIGENIEPYEALVEQICGDLITEMSVEADGDEHSWLITQLVPAFRWPKGLSLSRRRELTLAHAREVLLRRWPNHQVDCLGGRTFFEAAADPSLRMRLLALIDLEERLLPTPRFAHLFAELRSELGVLTPMEDGRSNSKRFPALLSRYTDADALSENELIRLLVLADVHQDKPAFGHLAPVFLQRESRGELVRAQDMLEFVSYTFILQLDDRDEAAKWIELARRLNAKDKAATPPWVWSLLEAHWHLRRGNTERAAEMLQEQFESNRSDPNQQEAFLRMAFSLGLVPPEMFQQAGPMTESLASQEPPGLWTPDSAAPAAGGGSGGGKLWVPD